MDDVIAAANYVRGRVRFHGVGRAGKLWQPTSCWFDNAILYDWASIVSRQLADGGTAYRLGGMYLEFKNVASPGDPVSPPAFDRSGGIAYYDGLSTSPDTDYLRVPLISSVRASSDAELFPDGNQLSCFARSQGTAGVHGKSFDDANNSKIYGVALVAVPDLADRTKDLVFSRVYPPTAEQQVKLATSQVGVEWLVTLN